MVAAFDQPSRDVALEWCRNNAPDLRIQHVDGASGARFTFDGRLVELEADGADHRDAIVRRVFETIRELQGAPVRHVAALAQARRVEQQIIAARYRGAHAEADALEQELLRLRASAVSRRPAKPVAHEGVIQQSASRTRTRWQW